MTARQTMSARFFRRLLLLSLLLLLAAPTLAWNAAGHRLSALIAWERLEAPTRDAVAALLRQHPDYERWQLRANGADPDLTAFLEASTWPDDIRHDKRFYTADREEPTSTQPGFPDMERRLSWHYVDRPLGPSENLLPSPGLIDRQLVALAQTVGDRKAKLSARAYALPWLIHLVGDAHQPLHAASRYGPDGQSDHGGNKVTISNPLHSPSSSTNLHRYWDDLPGPPWLNGQGLQSAAIALVGHFAPAAVTATSEQWIDESWRIASEYAYPPVIDGVPTITAEFHESSLAIAKRRVTEAGYHLAELLRQLLR